MAEIRSMEQALEESFLDYSAFVVQRRSTPDVRDGMKYTQRQILHAQYINKLDSNHPRKKSQKSVAAATSYSYVHGDAACYGQITRMGNPNASRYMFQAFKGNPGTAIANDDYAAQRYTETMLNPLIMKVFEHLNDNTLNANDWAPTYDEEGTFPTVLPSIGYYNIVNGQFGAIGSTMVSSIPQFNLREVNKVICDLIDNPEAEFTLIPDFATGGILLNPNTTLKSLAAGRGKSALIRGRVKRKSGYLEIIELPYGVYTETICKELIKALDHKDPPFTEYKDLSDEKPCIRIYSKDLDKLEKWLYKNTSVQQYFTIILNMLDGGKTPKQFTLREALIAHINHASLMFRRQYENQLAALQAREEIVKGLLKAHSIIDQIVPLIQSSSGRIDSVNKLISQFEFTKPQAEAIVDLRLHRLSGIDVTALQQELEDNLKKQESINEILGNQEIFNQHLKAEYEEVASKFGDKRRTEIYNGDEWEMGQDGECPTKDFFMVFDEASYTVSYTEFENAEDDLHMSPDEEYILITSELRGFKKKGSDFFIGDYLFKDLVKLNKEEIILRIFSKSEIEDNTYILLTDNNGNKWSLHNSYALTGASVRGKKLVSKKYSIIDITLSSTDAKYSTIK